METNCVHWPYFPSITNENGLKLMTENGSYETITYKAGY